MESCATADQLWMYPLQIIELVYCLLYLGDQVGFRDTLFVH